jgi:YTV
MKTKTRVDLIPVCTKTVMETKIETDYDEQVREVCRPVFDTVFESRCVTVCRPVCEVRMVCRPYRVRRPVTRTYQLTEYCLKPFTELITVPVKTKCGRCSNIGGDCTCTALARTCYRRVPFVREVTETHMVTEIQTEMVPVVHWRLFTQQRIERVVVTICRMVSHHVRVRVPRLVFKCVPKTLVYKTAVLSCEEIPVTVYRPVVKMVPVVGPSPQVSPSAQYSTSPSGQIVIQDSTSGPSPQRQEVGEKSRHPEKPRQPEKPKLLGTTAAPG